MKEDPFRKWTKSGLDNALLLGKRVTDHVDKVISELHIEKDESGFSIAKSFILNLEDSRKKRIWLDVLDTFFNSVWQVSFSIAISLVSVYWGLLGAYALDSRYSKTAIGITLLVGVVFVALNLWISSLRVRRENQYINILNDMSYDQYVYIKNHFLPKQEFDKDFEID